MVSSWYLSLLSAGFFLLTRSRGFTCKEMRTVHICFGSKIGPVDSGSSRGRRDPTNKSLLSSSSPTQEFRDLSAARTQQASRRDAFVVAKHLMGCLTGAVAISTWEDYDCSNLKPEPATLRYNSNGEEGFSFGSATRGMGQGRIDRKNRRALDRLTLPDEPSYNEIMANHRTENVPQWRRDNDQTSTTLENVRWATQIVHDSFNEVQKLKHMANEYEWDDMHAALKRPLLNSKLSEACSILKGASEFIDTDSRAEIGFDWGSCAMRHCGARADAQEALAELDNLVGLLEPYECLFILDVVERSLRDILAVVPNKYHPSGIVLPNYEPYKSQNEEAEQLGEEEPSIDNDFVKALSLLRNTDL